MSNLLKKEKGFTLIEIVLVLAIAGLLLVIVFLAVSGAQKSRRDTQRKNDVSRLAASLESYASNNNGAYPANAAAASTALATYVTGTNFVDPLTGTIYGGSATTGNVAFGASAVAPSGTAAATVSYSLSGRVYTICIGLEQGGSNCRDNK